MGKAAADGKVGPMRRLAPGLILLSSCVVHRPPDAPHPGPEIAAAVEGMYDDLSSRRWDALEAHFLPGASLVFETDSGVKRMTPAEFIETVRKSAEGKEIFKEEMTHAWIQSHGNLAIVWSNFLGQVGDAREVKTWSGVDAFTLVKVNGRWKVSQIAVSKDREEVPKSKDRY